MTKHFKSILSNLWWFIPVVLAFSIFHKVAVRQAYWEGADDSLDSVQVIVNRQIKSDSTATHLTIEDRKQHKVHIYLSSKSFKYK